MRIVLDTNVVLSALLEELTDVLTRSSATKRLDLIIKYQTRRWGKARAVVAPAAKAAGKAALAKRVAHAGGHR